MTISDIAKLAGVSVATVSRVLNQKGKVSSDVEKRVLKIIKEYNYIPNVTGRSLRTAQTMMLLIAIPTISNSFYAKIMEGIEHQASIYGYNIIAAPTQNNLEIERKYLQMLTSKQVDGFISFSTSMAIDQLNSVGEQFPFIIACECPIGAKLSSVAIDNYQASYEAVTSLIQKGHRHIGMLTGQQYQTSARLREKGYQSALEDNGIPFDPSLVISCEYNYKSGFAGAETLIKSGKPITAFFCVCDDMAVGVMKLLNELQLAAGKDIDVIGFDNTAIAEMYSPSISSIAQPCFEIGTTSVELLMDKIKDLNSTIKKVILPHQLIIRDTFHFE